MILKRSASARQCQARAICEVISPDEHGHGRVDTRVSGATSSRSTRGMLRRRVAVFSSFASNLVVETAQRDAKRLQGAQWVLIVHREGVFPHASELHDDRIGCVAGSARVSIERLAHGRGEHARSFEGLYS